MNIIIDTNVLCGLFDEADVHHEEAERLFESVHGARIFIPCIVVAELLASDVPGKKVLTLCKKLADTFLPTTEQELSAITNLPSSIRKTLKAND